MIPNFNLIILSLYIKNIGVKTDENKHVKSIMNEIFNIIDMYGIVSDDHIYKMVKFLFHIFGM